jgi:hypothetical protein
LIFPASEKTSIFFEDLATIATFLLPECSKKSHWMNVVTTCAGMHPKFVIPQLA